MKKFKYKKLVISFLSIGILAISLFLLNTVKKTYRLKVHRLKELELFSYYSNPFIDYFNENSQFPADMKDAYVLNPRQVDFKKYIQNQFHDILSRGNGLVGYIPLYNKRTLKREAFLLISAGIDGHLDLKNPFTDTLFINQKIKSVKFYNTHFPYKSGDTICLDSSFNLLDYFFGKKDYLIDYVNFRDFYLSEIPEVYSITSLVNRIKTHNYFGKYDKLSKQIYGYFGSISSDSLIGGAKYIYFKTGNFLIENRLIDTLGFNFTVGDSVALAGFLVRFDPKDKIISFKNCFVLKNRLK